MSGRFLHAGVALICVLGLLRTLSAQGAPPGPRSPASTSRQFGTQSNSGQVVSPVVLATYVARVWGDGTQTLQMLVMWRGSPGWFARGSESSGSGGAVSERPDRNHQEQSNRSRRSERHSGRRGRRIQGTPDRRHVPRRSGIASRQESFRGRGHIAPVAGTRIFPAVRHAHA